MKEPFARIDFIDYARGIAIISVFLYHAVLHSYGIGSLPWQWLNPWIQRCSGFLYRIAPAPFWIYGRSSFFCDQRFLHSPQF